MFLQKVSAARDERAWKARSDEVMRIIFVAEHRRMQERLERIGTIYEDDEEGGEVEEEGGGVEEEEERYGVVGGGEAGWSIA